MTELTQEVNQQITEGKPAPAWIYNDGHRTQVNQDKLAKHVLAQKPVKAIKVGSDYSYFVYNGINWEQSTDRGALKTLQRVVLNLLSQNDIYSYKVMNETAKTALIRATAQENPFADQPTNLIAFKNGTYDRNKDRLTSNRSFHNILNGHDYEANLDGTTTEINNWGKYMFGNSWTYMKQVIGYTFIPERTTFQTITILLDEQGGTGKSYFLNKVIRPLIGLDNISDNSIEDLVGTKGNANRFATFSLVNKLLNMHPDLKDHYIEDPDALKQLSGGDWIRTEGKNMNSGSSRNYALLLFASNHVPRIKIDSALLRRMHIVPVVAPSVEGNPSELAKRAKLWDEKKVPEQLGAFAIECIREAHKAIKRHSLTVNDEIKERTAQWASEQDIVAMFLADSKEPLDADYNGGVTKRNAYEYYKNWCQISGQPAYKKTNFEKALRAKGYEEKKTRKHPEYGEDTSTNAMSWQGLALDKYFEQ